METILAQSTSIYIFPQFFLMHIKYEWKQVYIG